MAQTPVKFIKTTLQKFTGLTPKDVNTFYYVTYEVEQTPKYDLYLGDVLLSNGNATADLTGRVGALETAVATLNAAETEEGSVAYAVKQLKDTLKAVATSGKAADVSIEDAGEFITATTVEGALAELASKAATTAVTVEKLDAAETGFAATYVVKQNGVKVGTSINIPKDFLVKSATIKVAVDGDGTGIPVGDKYIDFVINSIEGDGEATHLYLNVNDLVEDFTISNAEGAMVTLSLTEDRVLSADLADGTVTGAKLAEGTIARSKIDSAFEAQIAALESAVGDGGSVASQISTAIQALDAEVTQTASVGNGQLALSITEVDGKITAISGSIAAQTYDAYGSASSVLGTDTDTSADVTVKGVKAYAKEYADGLVAWVEM